MPKHKQQGFTLLEVLISLTILTIGSLAVFALMQQTVLSTERNRNSIIAVNLAREGMELVRNIRDTTSLGFIELDTTCTAYPNCNWIIDSSNVDSGLITEANNANINSCLNCRLYIKDGRYSHDSNGSSLTGLKRLIKISNGSTADCVSAAVCEKIVTVEVLQPGVTTPYTLTTHLTNWR